jgi:tetratricopeptide (TPR) repeat protein
MHLVRPLLPGILWSLCAAGFAACQTPPPAPAPAPVVQGQEGVSLREQAFGAENQGRFGEAAEAFLKLVKQEPGRAEWVVAAGRCLGRSGRFRDATDLLERARSTFPGVIEVPAMLARTYLLKSEMDQGALNPQQLWSDAAELAEGVLAIEPNHEDSRLVLAQARYLLGDWDEAVKQAEEAAKRAPDRAGAHILLGRIALDRYRDLLATHAAGNLEPQAEADLVAALDVQRKLATNSFARAAQLDPSRAHPHVMLAQVSLLEHHDEDARAHLLDALAIDPDIAIDHSLFDRALDWQTRAKTYAEVLARYRATPAASPQKAATLRWYEGRALYEGQQWEAARAAFEEALAANPQATNSHYYAAMCAFQLGDHDAAEDHAAAYATTGANAFAEVVRNLTGDTRGQVAAILKFLADRAFQKGRIDHSRDLNHVLAYLLDSADAWNNRALLCRDTGKFPEALDAYERALKKEPDSPQLLNDCAVILQYHLKSADNLAKATSMYERAIQLADKLLADRTVPDDLRQRTEQARSDAVANLAELRK